MRTNGRRAVLLLMSSLGLLRPAAAQQSFPASVDLVAVDVIVVDKQGRPLSDLRPEDFSVQVSGKPRRVVAAQLVGSASPRQVTGESTPPTPAAVAPAFSSNRDTRRGRLIVLVFDVGFMTTGGGRAAVEAAERFVARLGPQDHVAIVTLPTGPKVDFTTDHSRVAEAVRKVRGGRWSMKGPYNLSLAEAFGEADNAPYAYKDLWVTALARECRGVPAGCTQSLRSEAVRMKMSAQATADTSVSALRGLLGALRAIEGPKNMVLVSQGLVTGGSADPGANRRLDVVADDFARARTSLYTIHVDRTIADATDTAEGFTSATWFDDKALYLDGLEAIAGSTGGPLLRAQTTVDFAFERVALETSAGWLLSFEPEGSDRDGKPHDIRVKVARDGVELRARPRFVVDTKQTAPRSSEARARQSLDALLPDIDVPLAVTTLALNGNGGDIRLMVAAEVGLDSAEGTALGQRLIDAHGALVKGAITTGVLEPVRAPSGRALYGLVIIPVKPGTYTLKLAVATPTGRAGSIERLIDVRLRTAGPLLLSDLMVADTGRREAGLMVNVDGRLLGGDTSVLLEVSGAAAPPTVQFELVRAGESSAELMENARLRARDGTGRFDATAVLGLGGLAAGSYELRALVLQDGQEIGRVVRTVELLPESAAR